MGFKTTVKLSSRIFAIPAILRTVDAALETTAKAHVEKVRENIKTSVPTGRLYRRRGGFHRASARGQRPAVDTGNMLEAFRATKVLRTWVVDVAPLANPRNRVPAQKYAEILQSAYGKRKIITKGDAKDFEKVLRDNLAQELTKIV